jgi:heat shock protein HslJ
MTRSTGTLAWLLALGASAFGLLVQPAAATGASSPQPHRRGADPALVRSLQDHRWTLQSATADGGKPIEALQLADPRFVLRFDGARLSVQGGCNTMNGDWRLSPQSQLRIGRLAATMKACEPPLMAADTAMSALLAQPLDASIEAGDAPVLRLVTPDRQTLRWSGQRTPRSLYGAPTRQFLEVAPQRVACTPALMPPTTCLQVRERQFDAQGLRVGEPGPWRAFYGTIDGYTHQPGVRNVIRVDRYKRPNPPADASAYVYVLDLVVESEVVDKK